MESYARSRLKVGVDVPWVTSWSAEPLSGARPCASVDGGLAVFQVERPGFGRPNYSENHFRRQRESVRWMLCPMCGEPTADGDRWTLTAKRIAAGLLRGKGLADLLPAQVPDEQLLLNAGSIAPLHRDCAERSSTQCPHLSADPALELIAFPGQWAVAPLLVEARPVGVEHALSARPAEPVAIVGFLQLCGITPEVDPGWRKKRRTPPPKSPERPRRAGAARR